MQIYRKIYKLFCKIFFVIIVNETTSDIICVKCKQDYSDKGNEIVLCDQCGYGKYCTMRTIIIAIMNSIVIG